MTKGKNAVPAPFKHQRDSIRFFRSTPRSIDASDPGTGKTRVAIELFASRRRKNGGCALILAPKSLLETAWADDFSKFAPDMRVSVAYAQNRDEAFRRRADAYITNTDATRYLVKQPPKFFKKFDTLIVDEATYFKHPTSQRSKALAKIRKHFQYRHIMSGTLTPNSITDIWNPIFVVDDGDRLGKSFYAFRNATCKPVQVGPRREMVRWEDKAGAEEAVAGLISDITIRHKFEECTDIPKNYQYTTKYYLTKPHMKKYQQFEETALLELEEGDVTAVNAAVLANKLLQISSGAVYDSGGDYHLIDSGRYELVADLAAERKHCLVFFLWTHQRDLLCRYAEDKLGEYAVIDGTVSAKERTKIVRAYQEGEYQALFCHPATASHGLTLTRGTAAIWASPTYNLEWWTQANHRIYRAGQNQRTETVLVTAPDTIEEKVYLALTGKKKRMVNLLEIFADMER